MTHLHVMYLVVLLPVLAQAALPGFGHQAKRALPPGANPKSILQDILSSPKAEKALQMLRARANANNRPVGNARGVEVIGTPCGTNAIPRPAYQPAPIAQLPRQMVAGRQVINAPMQVVPNVVQQYPIARPSQIIQECANQPMQYVPSAPPPVQYVPSQPCPTQYETFGPVVQAPPMPMAAPVANYSPAPLVNPFLPAQSPVSAMAPPTSSLLPPAMPCQTRNQYLRKIPIPPPTL